MHGSSSFPFIKELSGDLQSLSFDANCLLANAIGDVEGKELTKMENAPLVLFLEKRRGGSMVLYALKWIRPKIKA